MTGKTIVITGGSSGIGLAAARMLLEDGHRVILVGRNPERTREAAATLGAKYHLADYTKLSEVRRLAEELLQYDRIDVLCNNAGGAQSSICRTEDGFEKTFQINVLGGFLLTKLLLPLLEQCRATVIQTSSIASNLFAKDPLDWNAEKTDSPFTAYGNAKLDDILFTRELDRRYRDSGISAVAFEPGVVRTNFASESTPLARFAYHSPLKYFFTISPERSAKRLVWLAEGEPGKDFRQGETYSKRRPMKLRFQDPVGEAARRLWLHCEEACERFLSSPNT